MEDKTHSGKSEIVSFSAPRDPKHRQISFGKFSKNHGESQPRRHSHHSCQPPQPPQPPQLPHLAAQLPQLHTGRPEPCNARLTNMKLSSNFIRAESSHHLQPPMCTQRDEGYIYIYIYMYMYIYIYVYVWLMISIPSSAHCHSSPKKVSCADRSRTPCFSFSWSTVFILWIYLTAVSRKTIYINGCLDNHQTVVEVPRKHSTWEEDIQPTRNSSEQRS